MAESEERKRRVRRVRKASDAPVRTPPVVIEPEEKIVPPTPIVETIPAKKEVPVEERGRIVIQDNVLMDIVAKIVDKGKAVVISRGTGKDWLIHAEDESEFSMGRATSLSEYFKEILTPEYYKWQQNWDSLSREERIEFATEMGVEWETHEEPRIDSMRMAQAVREGSNIQKYKDEYDTRGARNRIRPRS